jgi:hypothetical protein
MVAPDQAGEFELLLSQFARLANAAAPVGAYDFKRASWPNSGLAGKKMARFSSITFIHRNVAPHDDRGDFFS